MSDAIGVSCPDCGVKKNEQCVYLWPKNWDGTPRRRDPWIKSPSILAQMDRAGKPMDRVHTGRSRKAYHKRLVEESKAREAAYAAKNSSSRERDAVLRANADAMAEEHRQLREWLKANAAVLTGDR